MIDAMMIDGLVEDAVTTRFVHIGIENFGV
jgi:hypothetical protein